MTALIIIIFFVGLLLIGAPLFIAVGAATGACLLFIGDYPLTMMAQQIFAVADKSVLLALPFFSLTYTLLTTGSGAKKVVNFIRSIVGWLPGGMALATIGACILFASLSGFSPTAIVAVGALLYPGLRKSGFSENFSLGIVTTAGSLGILVPPSLVVIIFGIIGELNIEQLFMAGITPLALIIALFAAYSVWIARSSGAKREPFSAREVADSFVNGFWAILLPGLIIGGIYSGRITLNQAAALAAVYSFTTEVFFYRAVKIRQLPGIFRESSIVAATLLIIIALMFSVNWFFTVQGVPQRITAFITEYFHSKELFLLAVNLLLLLLGGLMDSLSAMFITVPLLLPAAVAMGVNPIHFGVIFIVNFELGCLVPPVGINLFTSSIVFKKPVSRVLRTSAPFIFILLGVLLLITYVPEFSLWAIKYLNH